MFVFAIRKRAQNFHFFRVKNFSLVERGAPAKHKKTKIHAIFTTPQRDPFGEPPLRTRKRTNFTTRNAFFTTPFVHRQTDSQLDMHSDGQTKRETGRQTGRHTDKQTNIHTERQTQTKKRTDRQRLRQAGRRTHIQAGRQTDRDRQTQ